MAKKKKQSKFAGKVRNNAQKTKQSGSQYGYLNLPQEVSVFQPGPGSKAWFDIMPYEVTDSKHSDRDDDLGIAAPGELWYKRPFKIHRNIGAGNDAVVCLASVGKPCPICMYRAEQIKKGADKEETDALKQSLRNLYVVIPKKSKKYEEKPHIWDVSQYLFQNLLTEELEEDDAYEVFPDLEEGLTLRVRFDSKTIGASKPFAEASRIDFEDRDEQYDEDILDDIPDLDKVLNVLTYKQLEAKFFEMEDEPEPEDDVEEEEEKPKKQVKKTARKKKKPEPEDSAEPDDDGPDDDDLCVACGGTGKNSKGKKCRICKGTGIQPGKKKTGKKEKCPHDYKFGRDTEEYDECDDCELWDECIEVKEDDVPF